ncbi:hypothetical protein ScalyP_jg2657, partial [Parmales sp. scaly parma]
MPPPSLNPEITKLTKLRSLGVPTSVLRKKLFYLVNSSSSLTRSEVDLYFPAISSGLVWGTSGLIDEKLSNINSTGTMKKAEETESRRSNRTAKTMEGK